MKKLTLIVILALVFGETGPGLAASFGKETWIVIKAGGKRKGAFVPDLRPYTEGGPAVTVPLDKGDIRNRDGSIVTGFEFIGWKEGSTNRVLVRALILLEDAVNSDSSDGNEKNLRRQDFATFTVAKGKTVLVEEMKTLNIQPMVVTAEARKRDVK